MNFLNDFGVKFTQSLNSIWDGVISFVPNLIGVIILFAIGWILASLVEKLIEGLFKSFKVDAALKSAGMEEFVERSGYKLNSGKFVGALVKAFVIVVFLIACFEILNLNQVSAFLQEIVLSYLPNVVIAVLILMVSVVIADAVQKIVIASARATHIKTASLLGNIAKWAIWIFALVAALIHLGVAPVLINTIVMGIVAAAAIATGLAFGLGGRDAAGKILEKTIHAVSDRD